MKYIAYAWGKGNDGVLFFVQRLEEMLFHYSDDIVKTPIHNTATLIEEYIILERDKNVKSFHLNMISDELIRSLQNDIIAKNRIGSKRIEGIINEIRINPNDTIHYLHGLITTSDYMKWCSNYLIEKLNKENAKEEITKGLRGWISAIIQSGYSPEYIYRYLKNEFDKEEIADPYNVCIDFLQHFNKENNEYRVYFRFYAIMKSYQSLLIERLEVSFDDDNWFDQLNNKKNKSFVGYVDIKAIDPYVAMEQAFNALNIFIKFYRVISNHKKAIVSNSGMVRRISDDVCMYLPVKSRGYKAIEVEPKMDLKSMIDSVVLGCQRKGANTYSHVNKAINLHNMALSQLDLNDGFVNLWSILEVVSSDSKEESKIKSVVDSVLPILQNDFFFKYFISLCDDIKTALNRTDYQNLLKCILHGDSPQW